MRCNAQTNDGGASMTAPVLKKDPANEPRIGEYAAMQPLSGTLRVEESSIVQGVVRTRYIRAGEKTTVGK
jgi:hypothetical protein